MKPINAKTKRHFAFWVVIFSAVFMTLNMNACGKKDKNGGNVGSPGPYPGCVNCPPGTGTTLAAAMGFNNEIGAGFNFSATQQVQQGGSYAGPVVASGFLHIKRNITCNVNVVLPPGIYQAATVQAGSWMGAWGSSMVQNLRMQAGPVTFIVGPQGWGFSDGIINGVQPYRVGPSGEQYPNYLAGDILIESVNGQPCGMPGMALVESIN